MSFANESSKMEAQVNFLFQNSRLPNIRNRLEMIKKGALNAESIIEENLSKISESRKEEIRALATQIHHKEISLHKSIEEFKNKGQELLNIIAEETKNYTTRAWQLKAEAERRRKMIHERSAARHQDLEREIIHLMQQCYSEIESTFDQSDLKEQHFAIQQHQQQQRQQMMNMMMMNQQQQQQQPNQNNTTNNNNNNNTNNGFNPNYTMMDTNNNNNNFQNQFSNGSTSNSCGFNAFSNNNQNNNGNNNNNNNSSNQNPFMFLRS